MALPGLEDLLLPILRVCATGKQSIRDIIKQVIADVGISAEEAAIMVPSGHVTAITVRIHWAKSYLKHAELVTQPRRGIVVITERGRDLLAKHPARIAN
ncbi:MAG: winged helix-turn-helix domain-containing protein, partial [Acetobacteraceae bacterium]|nr:winged helix-turn-helix domain-containing protein [Acetobacteraceae bacterium]